jgi:ferric-dicitrate binding protein FerR (iron transport regulator)
MSCVRPDRLADYARGRLDDARRAVIAEHVADCLRCSRALERVTGATLALQDAAEMEPPVTSEPRATATLRWLRIDPPRRVRPVFYVGFGLAAAAAGVFFMLNREPSGTPAVAVVNEPKRTPEPVESQLEALVTLLGGKVELVRGGDRSALAPQSTLHASDRLVTQTGSRLAAQWGDNSGFMLGERTELALSRLSKKAQRLGLERGQVHVRVRGPADLQVETPSHVVSVRGTWFVVAADGARTVVEVLEGAVEVTDRDGTTATLLHAPARGVFGPGRSTTGPLTARESAALRLRSELNLLTWPSLQPTGLLSISTDPIGLVAVDGVELGQTPLFVRRPAGRHYVEITRAGFEPVRRWMVVGPETGALRTSLVSSAPSGDGNEPVAIEEMVRQRGRQIRACYERSLKRDPSLSGTVALQLRVGASGRVVQTAVESSTLDAPEVASCLEREARTWRFSEGKNATVVYPFVFRQK